MLVNIFLFIIFIVFSAFFSASETAIFSLSKLKLRHLQEKHSGGKTVNDLLLKPARLLSAIVFGNMLVNISLSSLSAAIFVAAWKEEGLLLSIFLSGTIILFLGEILPKTIAIYLAERVSLFSAPILKVFSKVFLPVIAVIGKIVGYFSSFLIRRLQKKSSFSDEELKTALLLSKKEGQITEAEEEMISYVLEFKDTWVSEILTSRIDIEGIDKDLSPAEVVEIVKEKKHSKFPVYEKSLDNVIGILYAKDVFFNPGEDYHRLLREPVFIPKSKRIDDLLKFFLEKNERVAIVLDEYGGTEGLVTLEDIEEEIFGEMYDEFETPHKLIERLSPYSWRVYGKTPIKTINLELELELPEEEDVLAGFLLNQMEKIPRAQDKFEFKNIEFTIERATAKRIISVIIRRVNGKLK